MKLMTIGEKLRYFRKLKKMTQEQVAEELQISDSAYAKYETGESEITVNRLAEVAKVFNMKPQEILAYEKEEQLLKQILKQVNYEEENTQIANDYSVLSNKPAVLRKKIEVLETENELLRKRIADLEEIKQFLREKK